MAVWRRLRRLGVAQLADGVVGLPADARTREQLEWVAGAVVEGGGTAGVWLAQPGTAAQERELATTMRDARAGEYAALIEQADVASNGSDGDRRRRLRGLRAELRAIGRRDFFPPPQREQARRAVDALAAAVAPESSSDDGSGIEGPDAGEVRR